MSIELKDASKTELVATSGSIIATSDAVSLAAILNLFTIKDENGNEVATTTAIASGVSANVTVTTVSGSATSASSITVANNVQASVTITPTEEVKNYKIEIKFTLNSYESKEFEITVKAEN